MTSLLWHMVDGVLNACLSRCMSMTVSVSTVDCSWLRSLGSFANSEACSLERFRAPILRQPRTLACSDSLRGLAEFRLVGARGMQRGGQDRTRPPGRPLERAARVAGLPRAWSETCCARSPLTYSTKRAFEISPWRSFHSQVQFQL